jgi:hypothetical protein
MPSLALEIATLLITGGALYGAIRADLRSLRERIERHEADITRVHERFDNWIERGTR